MSDSPLVYLGPPGPHQAAVRGLRTYARGREDKAVEAFLGVPYAQPPTGRRRFRPPEGLPTGLWQGVRDATKYGSIAAQDPSKPRRWQFSRNVTAYSEDCLYLNVWRPATATRPGSDRRPVMVWIHGGAFVHGCSNIYDGTPLAAYEDVVFVSINYRVGVFGYMRTGEHPGHFHGNQGLLDQIEALRWIQKYIANFGGDPDNVTVFGESAGGISISFLQMVPEARGLFRRSICHSGSALHGNALWKASSAENYYNKRLANMGYKGNSPEELSRFVRSKSTEEFLAAFNDWFVPSTLDVSRLFPADAYDCYKDCGGASRLPAAPEASIIGFNTTEAHRYTPPGLETRQQAADAVDRITRTNFHRGQPEGAARRISGLLQDHYVHRHDNDNMTEAVCNYYSDANFVGASLLQAELLAHRCPVYVYQFDRRPSFSRLPDWVRADHTDEIPFALGFPYRADLSGWVWPDEERELSRRMMTYWANFARTGNPNSSDLPLWSQFHSDRPTVLTLSVPQGDSQRLTSDPKLANTYKIWAKTIPAILNSSQAKI